MLTSRCVYDLCFASYVTLYCFPGCIIFCSVILIQLLVQFTCTCMFNTNHCHKTPISWIPTAQTIDGDVMCQSLDNQLVSPPNLVGLGMYPRDQLQTVCWLGEESFLSAMERTQR